MLTPTANLNARTAPAEPAQPTDCCRDQPAQLPELSKLPQTSEKPDLAGAGAEADSALPTPAPLCLAPHL